VCDLATGRAVRSIGRGLLRAPFGVALTSRRPHATLVVADVGLDRVITFQFDTGVRMSVIDHGFNTPQCVAMTPDDQAIVVVDTGNHRICLVSLRGQLWRVLGGPMHMGANVGQFLSPRAVAIDSSTGQWLVAESAGPHQRLQLLQWGDAGSGLAPVPVVEHAAGCNGPSACSVVRTWGSAGAAAGQMCEMRSVAWCGPLALVTDRENNRLQVFRVADGTHVRTVTTGVTPLRKPYSVAVDGVRGWCVVTEQGGHCIRVLY
jgi:DNA-binding beta-propeller fold protein YncE